jgi:antitoxin PrlF
MPVAKITSKGQITIPRRIRKLLNLQAGDSISFLADADGRVSFMPANKSVKALKGIVPRPKQPVSLDDMNATIRSRGAGSERH